MTFGKYSYPSFSLTQRRVKLFWGMDNVQMKNQFQNRLSVWGLVFFFTAFSSAFAFGIKAVVFQTSVQKQKAVVQLNVQKGFGVQKEGRHVFTLYELSSSAKNYTSAKDKIKNSGTEIDSIHNINGMTAIEDSQYYSKINSLYFKKPLQSNKQYAFMAKVYVCSFDNGFCSVQREYRLLP